eukprot:764245-Hanusia_phi.AAC.1
MTSLSCMTSWIAAAASLGRAARAAEGPVTDDDVEAELLAGPWASRCDCDSESPCPAEEARGGLATVAGSELRKPA